MSHGAGVLTRERVSRSSAVIARAGWQTPATGRDETFPAARPAVARRRRSDTADPTPPILSEERIKADVRTLGADDVRGRGPTRPGEAKRSAYSARCYNETCDEFARWGRKSPS